MSSVYLRSALCYKLLAGAVQLVHQPSQGRQLPRDFSKLLQPRLELRLLRHHRLFGQHHRCDVKRRRLQHTILHASDCHLQVTVALALSLLVTLVRSCSRLRQL